MHGQLRSEYKARQRDPKVAAALAKKAEQWYTLTAQINDDNALALTEKLLTVNPDPLYLWNQRRVGGRSLDWETESQLTANALRNNPKAYGAWFHRKWCLVHLVVAPERTATTTAATQDSPSVEGPSVVLAQELALTVHFLERDERNFHCWNYRRFVVSMLLALQQSSSVTSISVEEPGAWRVLLEDGGDSDVGKPILLMGAQIASSASNLKSTSDMEHRDDGPTTNWIKHEWDFTQKKIEQNFSNFSAFHYRSKLFKILRQSKVQEGETRTDMLKKELELIENAIFTEPDDQTAWWYQSFLLRQEEEEYGVNLSNDNSDEPNEELWQTHVVNLRELAEEMPSSKWVALGLFNCKVMLWKRLRKNDSSTSEDSNVQLKKEELLQDCNKLIEMDPDRKGRYNSLIERISNDKLLL